MLSGRERAIIRWEARESLLRRRLERVEEQLHAMGQPRGSREAERIERLTRERDEALVAIAALGPDPRAKMG